MTRLADRLFICSQGHEGNEETVETDPSYDGRGLRKYVEGMTESGQDQSGKPTYNCDFCGQPMSEVQSR